MSNLQHSISRVNLEGLNESQLNFVKKLNVSLNYSAKEPEESIMVHGSICDCDDAFLCEHRLQAIIDYIKQTK